MTRLAWITSDYPPDRGGVSDHSAAMVSALRELGHDVLVCVAPQRTGFAALEKELAGYGPAIIVVAYTPLGYAPKTGGLSPQFARWCSRLRRVGAVTLMLAHETSMPAAYLWRSGQIKLALVATAQALQFDFLARTFHAVAFSNEASRRVWSKRLARPRYNLQTIRICSNIPLVFSADPAAELARAGYSVAPKTILFFGSGHPSVLFDYVEAALAQLLNIAPKARLVVVGMDAPKLHSMRPSLKRFGSSVQALGFVEARDVSLWLQVADLVLAPQIEGVNARKGTVMAALQHGRAVVTTRGSHTLGDIPWDQICAVAPLELEAYVSMAARCFEDADWRARLGCAARTDYEANASAPVTAQALLEIAERSARA